MLPTNCFLENAIHIRVMAATVVQSTSNQHQARVFFPMQQHSSSHPSHVHIFICICTPSGHRKLLILIHCTNSRKQYHPCSKRCAAKQTCAASADCLHARNINAAWRQRTRDQNTLSKCGCIALHPACSTVQACDAAQPCQMSHH